jgi:hypothetical protein
VARMNWDRARSEYRMAQGTGYWDRADAADDQWFDRELEREARHAGGRRSDQSPLSRSTSSDRLRRQVLGDLKPGSSQHGRMRARITALERGLEPDARRLGLRPEDLLVRRLTSLHKGMTVAAILAAERSKAQAKGGPERSKRAKKVRRQQPNRRAPRG